MQSATGFCCLLSSPSMCSLLDEGEEAKFEGQGQDASCNRGHRERNCKADLVYLAILCTLVSTAGRRGSQGCLENTESTGEGGRKLGQVSAGSNTHNNALQGRVWQQESIQNQGKTIWLFAVKEDSWKKHFYNQTTTLTKQNKQRNYNTPQLSLFHVNLRMELPRSGDNLVDVLTHHSHSEHCSSPGSKQIFALNNPLQAVLLAGTKPGASFMNRNV